MPEIRIKGVGLVNIPPGTTREDFDEIIARATKVKSPTPTTSALGHLWEAQKGIWSGVASGVAAIPEGIGAVTGNQGLKDIGQYIRDNEITENFAPNPGYEGSIPRQAGEIAGNLATMVGPAAGSAALRAPAMASRGLGALMGMMQGAAEQKREADRNRLSGMEVSPEQETKASRYGAATGLLDLLPVGRLLKPIERLGGLAGARELVKATRGEILKDIAKTGVAEGVTEAGQQVAQNFIEQGYNPNQEIGENVVESGIAGLGAGAGLDALIGGIARRIGRKANAAAENVRARQSAPEILPGAEEAIGVRATDDGQAEIRYIEAIAKAGTGKQMSELSQEAQTIIAQRAAELKALGISEPDAIALVGELPTLDQITDQPMAPPVVKRPRPGMPIPKAVERLPDLKLTDEGTFVDQSRLPTQIRRGNVKDIPYFSPVESTPTGNAPGPREEVVQPETVDVAAPVAEVVDPLASKSADQQIELQPEQEIDAPLSPEVAPPPGPVEVAEVAPIEAPIAEQFATPAGSIAERLTQVVGEKYAPGLAADMDHTLPADPSTYQKKDWKQAGEIADRALQYALSEGTDKSRFGRATVADGVIRVKPTRGYTMPGEDTIGRAQAILDAVLGPNAPKYSNEKFSVSEVAPEPVTTGLSVADLRKQVEAGERPQVALDVFNEMRRLGIDDIVSTRLVDTLSTPNANGKYADQIITLAMAAQSPDQLKATLNHEAVHAMKQLGLFSETEWQVLQAALNPNTVLSDEERRRYRSIYGDDQQLIQEEAVARGLERYADGSLDLGGEAQRVVGQKISMLDRLGSLFASKGLDTAESVGKAFREGKIGRREFDGAETDLVTLFEDPDEEGYVKESDPDERLSIQQQPVAGRIFAPPDPRTPLKKRWDAILSPPQPQPGKPAPLKGKLRQGALDARAGIEALSRKAGNATSARTSAIAAVRNADVASDFATASLKHGALEYVGTQGNGYFRARENSPAPFGKNGFFTKAYKDGKLDRTLHYLAGSRAEKLMAQGREKLLTPGQIATYKAYGQDPQVAAAAQKWKTFNDQMLDALEASGRFDAATIQKWKDGDYLSFYRIDPDSGAVSQPGGGSLSAPGRIVALKGSTRTIADPLENIVRNVNAITSMAMKNEAIQRIARDGVAYGYMKPAIKGAPNVVTAYVNGKPRKFQVTDQLLYDSVTASGRPMDWWMKLAAMPGNFLRESVTLAPPFWIRNMLRDSMAVWAQGYTPAPFLNILGDASKALSEGKSFQALERLGVVGAGIRGEGGASGTAENIRAVMDPSRLNPLERALKAVEDKSRKSEATNRLTVYESVMKRTGGDEAQAGYEARELLNFNRRGANPIAQVLTALIPFQNARWQGFDVGARSVIGRGANANMQRQLITRAIYLSAITAIYTALASQLPAWQKATEEERENSWFIPTGTGEAIKVPVPFEFGFVAKIIPERLTAMMMGEEGGKELLGAFKRFAFSTMKVDYAPQIVAPAEEVRTNYDKFRDREIESAWMRKLEKNYRADENTTELAKGLAPYTSLSPVQVDHLLRGYMGTTGMYAVNLADFLLGPQSVSDIPDRKLSQMPVIGSLFQREDGARKLIEFYAIREVAEQAAATLKASQKSRSPVEEAERQRMSRLSQFERQTRKSDERMGMATKIERQIRSDMKAGRITAAQGRATLDELRKQKIGIAEPVVGLARKTGVR